MHEEEYTRTMSSNRFRRFVFAHRSPLPLRLMIGYGFTEHGRFSGHRALRHSVRICSRMKKAVVHAGPTIGWRYLVAAEQWPSWHSSVPMLKSGIPIITLQLGFIFAWGQVFGLP